MSESRSDKAFPVSWDQFHRDARALAWRLSGQGNWQAIVCVTRGGLVPAAVIARELAARGTVVPVVAAGATVLALGLTGRAGGIPLGCGLTTVGLLGALLRGSLLVGGPARLLGRSRTQVLGHRCSTHFRYSR